VLQDAFYLFEMVMDPAHDEIESESLLCVIHREASLNCRREKAFRHRGNGFESLSGQRIQ
jgi:hypothetical protein